MKKKKLLNPWIVWIAILVPGLLFNLLSLRIYLDLTGVSAIRQTRDSLIREQIDRIEEIRNIYEQCAEQCTIQMSKNQ